MDFDASFCQAQVKVMERDTLVKAEQISKVGVTCNKIEV